MHHSILHFVILPLYIYMNTYNSENPPLPCPHPPTHLTNVPTYLPTY